MATRGSRPFRGEDSYDAERITRDMVQPFLQQKGYTSVDDVRVRYGNNESQFVSAMDPAGQRLTMHVQCCWRRKPGRMFSAVQLMAAIKDGDWEGSIRDKLARSKMRGATHSLFVQREEAQLVFAARVPLAAVLPIWRQQRRVSDKLIKSGALRRQTKNHAANGNSPTIWLQDDRTSAGHKVADVLWRYRGVVNLIDLPDMATHVDDTFDDVAVDPGQLGADGAPRVSSVRSMVKRDRRVRAEVLKRAKGLCERVGCGARRDWPGFLDVHHILGAEKSDRVWNCVALCPNCHREAHFAPDHDAVNAALLDYARAFRLKAQNSG